MARGLTAGMIAAVKLDFADACHFISLAFSGGTLYLSTGSATVTWDGHSWVAINGNISVDSVSESKELAGQGVRVTLDGVDQTAIAALLAQNYIGRQCQVYLVHFGTDGAIVADPYEVFNGLLTEGFTIEQTAETCTVSTRFVSPLTRFDEKRGIRATVASHSQHYNGDTFWRHLKGIANRKIFWGPTPIGPGGTGGGDTGNGGGGDDDDPNVDWLP